MSTPTTWYHHKHYGRLKFVDEGGVDRRPCFLIANKSAPDRLRWIALDDPNLTPLPDCTGWDWEEPKDTTTPSRLPRRRTVQVDDDGTLTRYVESRPNDPADWDELIHAAIAIKASPTPESWQRLRKALEPKQ